VHGIGLDNRCATRHAASVPPLSKGTRLPVTIRLAPALHGAAAAQAKARRWSLSQYVEFCVEEQLRVDQVRVPQRREASAPVAAEVHGLTG
jgi:poly(3-hydroxybutyrate) depolymerase